jgi:AcrR family transcriptional regulator
MPGSRWRAADRPAHRTTPAQGEETRAQLVAVATDLFASQGHAGVNMEQVSSGAAVTRGALYHHFGGKDDLFQAVCEQVAAAVTEQVLEAARRHPDAWSRLLAGCRAFIDACDDQRVRQILLTDAPSVLGWARFRELDARHGLGLLRAGIQAAMDEGSMEPGPAETLAHLLVAALDEAAMLIGQAERPAAARRDALLVIDRILGGFAGSIAQ